MKIIRPLFPLNMLLNDEFKNIDNKEIIKEIKTGNLSSPSVKREPDVKLSKDGSCKNLIKQIDELFNNIEKKIKVECEELWGQVFKKNECINVHSHYDLNQPNRNGFTFIYYPKAEKDSGNLVLELEFGLKDYSTEIEPKTGLLIILPLNIKHYTRKNKTDNDRISVAGNYIITGKKNDNN